MTRNVRIAGALVALCLTSSTAVQAQTARSAGNAQAMQQMQQLAAERTQLLTENARLKSELEAAKKERDELKKKEGGADSRLRNSEIAAARAERTNTTLQAELDREKSRMADLVSKFRETTGNLRDVETDRTAVKATLAQRDTQFAECVARNQALYDLNGEILAKFETNRRDSIRSPIEVFTHLKHIELDNLIDGYQQRAEEQKPPRPPETAARTP